MGAGERGHEANGTRRDVDHNEDAEDRRGPGRRATGSREEGELSEEEGEIVDAQREGGVKERSPPRRPRDHSPRARSPGRPASRRSPGGARRTRSRSRARERSRSRDRSAKDRRRDPGRRAEGRDVERGRDRGRDRERERGRDRGHRERHRSRERRRTPEEEVRIDDDDVRRLEAIAEGVGLTAEEEEQRQIEERRRRRAEILAARAGTEPPQGGAVPVPAPAAEAPRAPEPERDVDAEAAQAEQELAGVGEALFEARGAAQGTMAAADEVTGGGGSALRPDPGNAARPQEEDAGADDDDDGVDIFAETPPEAKGDTGAPVTKRARGLADQFDDTEGYYIWTVGETLDGRYEVFASHGRGVFGSVLRARDLHAPSQVVAAPGGAAVEEKPEVAIKVARANETMFRQAQTEKLILSKIAATDPDGRRHCVRMLGYFEHRGHACIVFEAMDMDLRSLVKKVGRNIGIHVKAVRAYAVQLLVSLKHLRDTGILHADIKPDNILVNKERNTVKLADFGSAMFAGDNELTPYLVSRFYRAPEVILGLPYSHAMDMWALGCVLFELYTGSILFPGRSNNDMLRCFMDLRGAFPKKMLRRAAFRAMHFEGEPHMSFRHQEVDKVTGKEAVRVIGNPTPSKTIAGLLGQPSDRATQKQVELLADLLDKMTCLDPDRRISVREALQHPFVQGDAAPRAGPRAR
ncbi:unnamed protein product [Pedinophyceae sp. YPF-701]|nr:unnamed protein product [Pedinophyceae sp. YPF-701]